MKKIYLLLISTMLLIACPMDEWEMLWIRNNSNQVIIVTGGYVLPDTLLLEAPTVMVTVGVNQSEGIDAANLGDKYLQRMKDGEKLTLFILSKDSVDKYAWEHLRENNVILKRYDVNWQDLQMMGDERTIIYQ